MINNFEGFILCSLCNRRFPSREFLIEHSFLCENRIDRCPQCEDSIRQSLYIYPNENNFISDEYISPRRETILNVSLSIRTFNNDQIYYQIPRSRSEQSIRIREEIWNCLYCGKEFDRENLIKHQYYCIINPKNHPKRYEYPNQDRSNKSFKKNYLFCKYCQQFFEESNLNKHENICQYQFEEFQRELLRRREKSSDLFIRCSHCGILFTKAGLKIHQTNFIRSEPYYSNSII